MPHAIESLNSKSVKSAVILSPLPTDKQMPVINLPGSCACGLEHETDGNDHTDKDNRGLNLISDSEAERIQALPFMSELLPIGFANGGCFAGIKTYCGNCKGQITAERMRAEVNLNPTRTAASVLLWGVCEAPLREEVNGQKQIRTCKTLTPVELRIKDDGKMLIRGPMGWAEHQWGTEKQNSLLSMLTRLIKRLVLK